MHPLRRRSFCPVTLVRLEERLCRPIRGRALMLASARRMRAANFGRCRVGHSGLWPTERLWIYGFTA
jgi:hypothetical protein